MLDAPLSYPLPPNEPILSYASGTPERAVLKDALRRMGGECPDIPHVIGGQAILEGPELLVRSPHAHAKVLGKARSANAAMTERAISAALKAAPAWAATSFEERARIFLRMADLLAGPWRQTLNAATMWGQSKNVMQAEIDAACELVDFLRFNVHFASKLAEQPVQAKDMHNALELRPLEGFVLALTPFNFTAIAANLPAVPALMGNVVVWKPSETQGLSAYHTMRLFEAAGLPPGVINVVHGDGATVSGACLQHEALAGVNFTGSTQVFRDLWRKVGERIGSYRSYPRLVGETGGKDFVFAHPSADVDALATALVRGAYEFQGQKCSAASRAYVPASIWPKVKERVLGAIGSLRVGDVSDFRTFMGAVINERAFDRLAGVVAKAEADSSCKVLAKGHSKEVGWFVKPTLIEVSDPKSWLMQEEFFGPILSVYVYDDARIDETLALVDSTSPYALTGAVFSQDRAFVTRAARALRQAAGNFYINDKPTGAVVGQQPFGGARASGTNDKAGSPYNLLRWVSPRTVKENFVPPTHVEYPHMGEE
jgi:1-pyrroline-5-carboxylate dehydrogenase